MKASGLWVVLVLLACCRPALAFLPGTGFQDSQIAIIPDRNHGDPKAISLQLQALQMIRSKDSRYSCLFLEVPGSATGPITDFMTGERRYSASVGIWINQLKRVAGGFLNVIPEVFLRQVSNLGFRVYGVDHEWDSSEGRRTLAVHKGYTANSDREISTSRQAERKEYVQIVVENRSRLMASNLDRVMRSENCSKGILIVGYGHTKTTSERLPVTPVQAFLQELGYVVKTLDLQK